MTEPSKETGSQAAPDGGEQLHPAPSMWWFVIPLALIVAYAVLTR